MVMVVMREALAAVMVEQLLGAMAVQMARVLTRLAALDPTGTVTGAPAGHSDMPP